MNKKSFKDNPALRFISEPQQPQEATAAAPKGQGVESIQPTPQSAPVTVLRATPRPESKSKRVQLLIRPSVYNKAVGAAARLGVSFNEYAHRLLEKGEGNL